MKGKRSDHEREECILCPSRKVEGNADEELATPAKRYGNMRNIPALTLALPLLLTLSACFGAPGPVGNTAVADPAKPVELTAYLGKWYEYGRYEAPFQKGCEGVTADYSLRDDGKIQVVNACYKDALDGKYSEAKGRAKIVEGSQGAKLKVSFFGPFYGDYWVLDRSEPNADGSYQWSIVGEPSGRYLWMLTREAKPDAELRTMLEARVRELGYDWGLVRITQQPPAS